MSEPQNALVKTKGARNSLAKKPQPGFWEKLMALFRGEQAPDDNPLEYMPIDTLPPDAQYVQRRKAKAFHDAMDDK